MVHKKLIDVVKNNISELADAWLDEARKSENMLTYHKLTDDEIKGRGKQVFENLSKWLEGGANVDEVEKYFCMVGKTRINEGFPLTEVHFALYITKKILYNYIDWRDAVSGSFSNSSATQILSTFNNYFDLGNFFITKGYLNELFEKLDESKKLSRSDLKNLLLVGNPNWEQEEEEFVWRHV